MEHPPTVPGPQHLYQQDVESGVISRDASQQQAVAALERRFRALLHGWQQQPTLLQRLLRGVGVRMPGSGRKAAVSRGVYLWGGVGRGKTYLMDLFFHALPGQRKLRMHFHRFMLMVHKRLRSAQGQSDPLVHVARELADEVDVLCFDEFFVSDIGDAMILTNLLQALFAEGVMLVATSNIEPSRLYERGLQRQSFLPAIALLQTHCEVMNIDGGVDYRLRSMDKVPVYLWPCESANAQRMLGLYQDLTRGLHVENAGQLEVEGRLIAVLRWTEGVAWFDFAALCRGPRGAADYIELARRFHTVFVQGVPCFTAAADDEARRFITLVDEFYDHGVKLVLLADCALPELYTGEELRFAFERTTSRLLEMQTRTYLGAEHHPD